MGILDGATTAINAVQTAVTTGPANALSQASSALTSLFSGLGAAKLPQPNILSNYATYNYVLGIGVLTDSELNNPDETYMLGNFSQPYICKSAGSEPSQRVRTAYGKFDFFVENLVLNSTIGFEKNNNTNITGITFEIIEPYSMGMFLIACQTAAYNAGWNNYKEAPFILTIQFRGNTQQGQPQLVPNSTRYMPFRFSMLNMKVTEKGAVYHITAIPYNYTALASRTAKFKSDVSAKGATVQEVLQTGEKSLQKVINDRLQQYKDDKTVKVADQVLILFPQDISSSAAPAAQDGNKEDKSSATTSGAAAGSPDPYTKLGVSKSKINDTLIQPEATCNALGKASMGFGLDKKGDPIIGQEAKVWDAKNKVWVRGNNQPNLKYGEMRFSQDTDIINAINQVLLASNFPKETLDESKVSKEGMRDWWTIDTQVFTIPGDENLKTGSRARLIVYRVYPYQVSVGRTMPPNTPPPGVTALKKQAVKEYNYLYTGKNTEVLKFDIEFSASFAGTLAADNLKRSQDVANAAAQGAKKPEKETDVAPEEDGSKAVAKAGIIPTTVGYWQTLTSTDRLGGGGAETQETRAARLFHDAITRGKDMVQLNMEIWGDPYYIAQSGIGNYSSQAVPGLQNLNKDGSVNWQNGEVYITVNFRTPTDINQGTGLYNFAGSTSAPVIQFSGLYQVRRIRSTFNSGAFKQVLMGSRLDQQENPSAGTPSSTYSTSKKVDEPKKE